MNLRCVALVLCLVSGLAACRRAAGPAKPLLNATDGLEYVTVPAGTFDMGAIAGDSQAGDDEKARPGVVLAQPFQLGRTEVTVAAFGRFVAATGRVTTAELDGWSWAADADFFVKKTGLSWRAPGFEQTPDHPVVHVSWYDAEAYCAWVGGRLPSEIQWERAARAGVSGRQYAWGGGAPLVEGRKQANVADDAAKRTFAGWTTFSGYDDGYVFTSPVGAFAPNEFGLFDLAGNVVEWCADWYHETPVDGAAAAVGVHRVLRGGGWADGPTALRVSRRNRETPANHLATVGFRCVLEAGR
jgi:formylglycine-generating enzyme required for sulfatase activity